MTRLLESWSKLRHLHLRGESSFEETNGIHGSATGPLESSCFELWATDLNLTAGFWHLETLRGMPVWNWTPFPRPFRYRLIFQPRVRPQLHRAPTVSAKIVETCNGNVIVSSVFKKASDTRPSRYEIDPVSRFGMFDWQTIGLHCLPPIVSIGHLTVLKEIEKQGLTPDTTEPGIESYSLFVPDELLEVRVKWDLRRQWFTSISSRRRGVAEDLLVKLRAKEVLTEAQYWRLQDERVTVETIRFEATKFDENSRDGIVFPHHLHYSRISRQSTMTRTWKIEFWDTSPELSADMFECERLEGIRVVERRPKARPQA